MKEESPKGKILVVDDDENIVKTVKIRLEETGGYQVITASDGQEGLEAAKAHNPDLILLNVMMPHLNGIMATLRLKGTEQTKSIPVIIMTGIKERDEMILAKHVGAADYITKPFESADLLKKIERLLSKK